MDEFLKAHGTVKLSLDDLDKVSGGGSWDTITVNGIEMGMKDFNDQMIAIADALGFSVAAKVFEDMTGFPCDGSRALDCAHSNHVNDRRLMAEALQEFWAVRKLGNYTPGS